MALIGVGREPRPQDRHTDRAAPVVTAARPDAGRAGPVGGTGRSGRVTSGPAGPIA